MSALVTGGAGFIGSHLVRALVDRGIPTALLLRPAGDRGRLAELLPRVTVYEADLEDAAAVGAALAAARPATVFHAAWFGVGNAHRNDPGQLGRNLQGTMALVAAAAAAGAQTFIGFGSQAEYGPANRRLNEDAPTTPTTWYGVAKLAAGHAVRVAGEAAGIRTAWLRVFSTYGPGDAPGWLLPYLAAALLRGERPALTAGEQRWDYLFVEDAARAALAVAESPSAAGVFNLGSGTAAPLRAIIERMRDLIDPALPLGFGEVPYRPDQVMFLEADVTRLRAATNWAPRVSLDDGLARTVAWARTARDLHR